MIASRTPLIPFYNESIRRKRTGDLRSLVHRLYISFVIALKDSSLSIHYHSTLKDLLPSRATAHIFLHRSMKPRVINFHFINRLSRCASICIYTYCSPIISKISKTPMSHLKSSSHVMQANRTASRPNNPTNFLHQIYQKTKMHPLHKVQRHD